MLSILPKLTRFLIVISFISLLVFYPQIVGATNSCTASASPASVQANSTTSFSFSITNTGSETVNYVRVMVPSENFTLQSSGVPSWTVYSGGSLVELVGGSVAPSSVFQFSLPATAGNSEAPSANWQVVTNTGTGEVSCTGSLGTTISGVADVLAPELSETAVTGITTSSATVSWTTNEASNSKVEYGPTEDLGFSKTVTTLVASHSVTLNGLSANTAYYYSAVSTDASGNIGRNDQNSLTTASSAGSTKITIPPPQTIIKSVTDTAAPGISITTNFSKPFEQPPLISGRATDAYGIAAVEYSTDGGVNWLPTDKLTSPGKKSTTFNFVPILFDDGNYQIVVRATDGSGNRGVSKIYTLVIDRLPPIVGSALISIGPLVLTPNENGQLVTISGVEHKVILSAAGGPVTIDLLIDNHVHSFSRSHETGLWNGAVIFAQSGFYELIVKAKDGGGNVTERRLTNVIVLDPGQLEGVDKGTITVYYQEPASKVWYLWDSRSFGQTNPRSFKDGTYSLFLPAGTYYLKISAPGYKTVTSSIFRLDSTAPINTDFTLEKTSPFSIFDLFRSQEVKISESQPPAEINPLLGKRALIFFLPAIEGTFESVTLRGHSSVLSFVNTWSDSSIEQISILDKFPRPNQIGTVVVQDNLSRIKILAKRGEYDLNLAIDEDGLLVDDFGIFTLPTHVFMDRKGVIKRVVPGVLTEEEIEKNLLDIL